MIPQTTAQPVGVLLTSPGHWVLVNSDGLTVFAEAQLCTTDLLTKGSHLTKILLSLKVSRQDCKLSFRHHTRLLIFLVDRDRLRCNATVLTRQPLSTYSWPRRRSSVLEWLDSCVKDAVRQLDSAPFVQLVYSERAKLLETHHVPRTATGPSEVSLFSRYLRLRL